MDLIAQALLHKCAENTIFVRDDIDRSLTHLVEQMPQSKTVLALINGGAQ